MNHNSLWNWNWTKIGFIWVTYLEALVVFLFIIHPRLGHYKSLLLYALCILIHVATLLHDEAYNFKLESYVIFTCRTQNYTEPLWIFQSYCMQKGKLCYSTSLAAHAKYNSAVLVSKPSKLHIWLKRKAWAYSAWEISMHW